MRVIQANSYKRYIKKKNSSVEQLRSITYKEIRIFCGCMSEQDTSKMVLTKVQLQELLNNLGVSFPDTATVIQLRKLYADTLAAGAASGSNILIEIDATSAAAANSENQAVVDDVLSDSDEPNSSASGSAATSVLPPDNSAAILEKLMREKQILELQKAISELRNQMPTPVEVDRQRSHRIEFRDVENAVNEFTGDDAYGVRKWLEDFEEVVDSYNVQQFRYVSARRLLKGTAKRFVRSKHLPDYATLRTALLVWRYVNNWPSALNALMRLTNGT